MPNPAWAKSGRGCLIVSPTFNEANNLLQHVSKVRDVLPEASLLIVDDGSPDGTGDIATELAARDPHIQVLQRGAKRGLGTAYVEGFALGLAQGFSVFFAMDADLSHDARSLPAFLAALEQGADVVAGSRIVPGGRVEGWGLGRRLLSRGGSFYARVILQVPIQDMTTGFKAYTRRALEVIDLPSIRSNGYSFQIETTFRALRRNLNVVEVPIVFVDRRADSSKMDGAIFLEAMGVVWKLRSER